MDNTKEEEKNCTPDEACCCDPAPEQAPVTREELQAAIDHVLDLVGRYRGRAVVAAFIEGDDKTRRIFKATYDTFESAGANSKVHGWTGVCGYLVKAHECLDNNAKTIGEGVRLFLEYQNKERREKIMNPIAAMLGIAGCECEECEED